MSSPPPRLEFRLSDNGIRLCRAAATKRFDESVIGSIEVEPDLLPIADHPCCSARLVAQFTEMLATGPTHCLSQRPRNDDPMLRLEWLVRQAAFFVRCRHCAV